MQTAATSERRAPAGIVIPAACFYVCAPVLEFGETKWRAPLRTMCEIWDISECRKWWQTATCAGEVLLGPVKAPVGNVYVCV